MTHYSDVQAADIWWATQDTKRKVQIHRWVDPTARGHQPVDGQFEIDIPQLTDTQEGDS